MIASEILRARSHKASHGVTMLPSVVHLDATAGAILVSVTHSTPSWLSGTLKSRLRNTRRRRCGGEARARRRRAVRIGSSTPCWNGSNCRGSSLCAATPAEALQNIQRPVRIQQMCMEARERPPRERAPAGRHARPGGRARLKVPKKSKTT